MELKKNPKADLRRYSGLFLEVGFVVALGVVLGAFSYTVHEKNTAGFGELEDVDFEDEIIPITRQQEITPPPPPEVPKIAEVINIVEDDVEIDDELDIADVEADQDTEVAIVEMTEEEEERIRNETDRCIVLINKSDMEQKTFEDDVRKINPAPACLTVSALEAETLQPLKHMLKEQTRVSDRMAISQPRHLDAVKRAIAALKSARETMESMTPDMASTDLQAAQAALAEITGDRADEKLLDRVFSTFCVGK